MRIFLYLLISIVSILSAHLSVATENASGNRTLELSKTLTLTWPTSLAPTPLFMPKTGFFLFKGNEKNKFFEAETWRKTPTTLATETGVNRYWKENNIVAAKGSKLSSNDLGCKEIRSGSFICRRTTSGKNQGTADLIAWNRGTDLFYLHVKSSSPKSALQILDSMAVVQK